MAEITNLKYMLLVNEVSQHQVAVATGMHDAQLSRYALGREPIPIKHLRALCKYFKCSQQQILGMRTL